MRKQLDNCFIVADAPLALNCGSSSRRRCLPVFAIDGWPGEQLLPEHPMNETVHHTLGQ
jgi:hypothetical protein